LDESHLIKDRPYSMGSLKIIHRISDVLMAISFNYINVIVTIGFFVIKCY